MSSSLWFKQAKAAVRLAVWMDQLHLFAPPALEALLAQLPADLKGEGRGLLAAFRAATAERCGDILERKEKREAAADRRARTDAGRESDARAASAGNLVL